MRLADLFTRKPKPDTTAQALEKALVVAKAGDYAAALSIWEPLARAGNARAQNNIGACFAGGMGVEKNVVLAQRWLTLSAAAGDASGQRNLASLLFKGEDIEADYPEAARLYRLAAEQGDPQAQDMLSWMLMEGEVMTADPVEAREWALKAAEGGIAAAMTRLGMIYHNALGVPRDPSQAVYWWRNASAAGDPDGEAMLGAALHLGMGVERDPSSAYEHLLRAEAGGSTLAAPFIEAARNALNEKAMIVGTAGHIDHGKTSLVRALTQVDTDRLKEEKARGISIDLGFAYLPLSGDEKDILGFVDVPGHEKFVHTMLAGAASIDFVMLVVAADDGIMPQTREHLAIVNLLGIRRGIAVITKSDLVEPDRLVEVETAISNELALTGLADIPVLAVSTVSGAGIDDLKALLEVQAHAFGERRTNGRFRLAVDRSFTLKGAGTVVTGTVLSGKAAIGDHLVISPSGKEARIRTIHAQNQPSEIAQAGDRCALNLAGDGISKEAIHRGDMLVLSSLHRPTDRIDALLQILSSEKKPIGQWFPVRLHHASTEVGARIVLLRDEELQPGTEDRVQLVLDRPVSAAAGDRFVIRDVSAQRTIGGGRFLDLRPPQRKRRSPERMAQLDAHSIDDPVESARALLTAEPYYLDATAFLRDRALADDPQGLAHALDAVMLPQANSVLLLLPERWDALRDDILALLATFHDENPDLIGMGVERLRLLLKPRLPAPAFRAAIAALVEADLLRLDGAWLRLRDHEVTMSDADEALWQRIAPLLGGEARFRPPRVRDIAGLLDEREEDIRRLLKLSGRMGRVHEVAHDHFFLRGTIAEMIGILSDMDAAFDSGWFIAARFRDRVDSGRKVAIQILEFFDRNSVTIRRGDMRRLNRRKLDLFGDFAQGKAGTTGGMK